MRDYETYARKYPAIIGMLIPAIITTEIIVTYFPQIEQDWISILAKLGAFVPVACIYGALGYFARMLFRDASKALFQFPMFKEDETEMPTTVLLLKTSKNRLSNSAIDRIAQKVENDFGIKLFSEEEEKNDILEAKRTIVDAVGKMREVTRTNSILHNYNIDFGFCRNYLGATIYSLAILVIILFINLAFQIGNWRFTIGAMVVQLLFGVIVYFSLKSKGYSYARALFNAYLSI